MQDYIPRSKDINQTIEPITIKQFDNNSRFLHVQFTDIDLAEDENAFDLENCTTALYIEPEGNTDLTKVNFVNGNIESAESGIVTFLLPGGVTQTPGDYTAEIWIYQGDETLHPIISSKPFKITVEKSIKNDSAIEATQSMSALDSIVIQFQSIKNQMAALVASPAGSGGDTGTELRDIRIGANGTEYGTAGDAVRTQATNLAADATYLNGVIKFESGAFDSTYRKNKIDNVKRIRNTRPIPADQYLRLTLPDGYTAYFWLFDKSMTYLGSTQNVSSLPVLNTGYPALKYINIQITKTGAENEDISHFVGAVESGFTTVLRSKTDTSLSTSNLPADAKAVGDLFTKIRKVNYIHADYEAGLSANNLKSNGVYFSSKTDDFPNGQITDLPFQPAWLEVTRALGTGNIVLQVAYPWSTHTGLRPQMRVCTANGEWRDWVDVGTGTNNSIINNLIQNTYNVTAAPTLTSGLPYVLQSTGDTTDRTADIVAVLSQYGSCYLGTGVFYVKNLTMPDNTSIIGSGIGLKTVGSNVAGGTTLRLIDDDVNECYAVGVRTRCSISNLVINGGLSTNPETEGLRHGLSYQGTYISSENPGTYPMRGQISNLDVKGFSGSGIICSNTSGRSASGMNAVNINIYDCYNGIEIKNYSEYHKFTNCSIVGCVYGCINNGGNNMFVNCGFNSNTTGFVIDVSGNEAPNDAHGSAVGCTFNHSGNNSGTAIKLVGVTNGYVFDGCQVFYGKIDMKNSVGVQFSNCNIGRQVPIDIDGGGVILFNGNIFVSTPTVTKTNSPIIKTANCYAYDGSAITI